MDRRGRPPPAPRPPPAASEWDGHPLGPVRQPAPAPKKVSRPLSAGKAAKPPILLREEAAARRRLARAASAELLQAEGAVQGQSQQAEGVVGQSKAGAVQGRSRSIDRASVAATERRQNLAAERASGGVAVASRRTQSVDRAPVASARGMQQLPAERTSGGVAAQSRRSQSVDGASVSSARGMQKLPGERAGGNIRSSSSEPRRCKQVRPSSTESARKVGDATGGAGRSDAIPSSKPASVLRAEAAAARRALSQPAKQAPSATGAQTGIQANERGDAALLVLRGMLGAHGSSEKFRDMIEQWRSEHVEETDAEGHGQLPASANGIIVAVRVRPILAKGPDAGSLDAGDFEAISVPREGEVVVHSCGLHRDGVSSNVEHKAFHVHAAYDGRCDGTALFQDLMAPLVGSALTHSAHATALCYGQTGSGKTHTQGNLIEQTAQQLFSSPGVSFVGLEAFELTGSVAYSLQHDSKQELLLCEGKDGVVHVGRGRDEKMAGELPDLCEVASNVGSLVQLCRAAARRRAAQDTDRNAASSRSHAFYRMHVLEKLDAGDELKYRTEGACIEMVDLAGSESNKDSLFHDRERVEDTAKINASLMALNDCIRKQSQGTGFIPFRADKLTLLLRPCFMKRLKAFKDVPTLLFIACLSPLASDTHQSGRTLAYAQQLSEMKARTRREAAEALKHRAAVGLKEWDSSRGKPSTVNKNDCDAVVSK